MAKSPTVLPLSGSLPNQINQINANFTEIKNSFFNTLSLDGSVPNAMQGDFDLNNNDILNAKDINVRNIYLNGQLISPTLSSYAPFEIVTDTFVGDNSTVAFVLSRDPLSISRTFVFLDGVFQKESNYSLSGTTLTFVTAPGTGVIITVRSFVTEDMSMSTTVVNSANTALVTPYDYGAQAGTEESINNSGFVQAMIDDCTSSWDATTQSFGKLPSFAAKVWRCDSEIWFNNLKQPGFSVFGFGGGVHSHNTNGVAVNALDTNQISFNNFYIYGNKTNTPDVGLLYGVPLPARAAPGVNLFRVFTGGNFNKAAGINLASEAGGHFGCYFRNESPIRTATSFMWADNVTQVDARLTGGSATLQASCDVGGNATVNTGTWSNLGHAIVGSDYIRSSPKFATIAGITRGATTEVQLASGALATTGWTNGVQLVFHNIVGTTELETGVYTIENIDIPNDTFELVGVNSTGYGAFVSGIAWQASGPAVVISSAAKFHMERSYLLAYSDVNHIIDFSNTRVRSFHMSFQAELDNQYTAELIMPGSGVTATVSGGFFWENMNAAQKVGDAVFKVTGLGSLSLRGGKIKIANAPAPAELFDDPSRIGLRDFKIEVPDPSMLNPAADYGEYDVVEVAYGRFPLTHVYKKSIHYESPTFRVEGGDLITAKFESIDTTASGTDNVPPYVDLYRNAETPGTHEVGRIRFTGHNDAATPEVIAYGQISTSIVDETDGTEDGKMSFLVYSSGSSYEAAFVNAQGLFSQGARVLANVTATQAELEEITDAINLTNKFEGKQVWDSTNKRPVWSAGTLPSAVWVDHAGSTVYTPV